MVYQNIHYALSGGESGGSAGDFFQPLLEIVLVGHSLPVRLELFAGSWAHADLRHLHELDPIIFPKVNTVIHRFWDGSIGLADATTLLKPWLEALPALLLLSLPELREVLYNYASTTEATVLPPKPDPLVVHIDIGQTGVETLCGEKETGTVVYMHPDDMAYPQLKTLLRATCKTCLRISGRIAAGMYLDEARTAEGVAEASHG